MLVLFDNFAYLFLVYVKPAVSSVQISLPGRHFPIHFASKCRKATQSAQDSKHTGINNEPSFLIAAALLVTESN